MARKRTLIIILILLGLAAVAAGTHVGLEAWREHRFLTVPPEQAGHDVLFRVSKGQPLSTIARNLKKQNIITDTRRFLALAVRQGKSQSARAGQFRLNTGWLPNAVLTELTSTPGIMKRIGFREGLNWWQTARIAARADMGTVQEFDAAVHDRDLLQRYGIPADSVEGYLFPETYLISPPARDRAKVMVATMLDQFFAEAAEAWPAGLPPRTKIHKAVILASLVEKETGKASERRRIAGVFANRLKRGMLLQTDPTIIYGLGPEFDGNLRRSHLKDKTNPYNTYMHPGLPPGPICSPGLDSLRAVLDPEPHNYLYFVAKGDGTHHFSATLAEHNRAVHKYQIRRNRSTYRSYEKKDASPKNTK